MVAKSLRATLSRFTADYGMVFVLLLLCAFFSIATFKEQNPTGADAGIELARDIAGRHGGGVGVVVLAAETEEGRSFASAVRTELEARGGSVRAEIRGGPPELRSGLESVVSERPVSVIACSRAIANYGFLRERAERFPAIASAELEVPLTYSWPDFLKAANLRAVANRIAVIAIIAIGMTLVIITAGIDLSVGSLIALSAVVAAYLIRELGGAEEAGVFAMTAWSLVAVMVAALMGAFSGLMVTLFRVPAFIATLSMMQIASGLAYILSNSQSIYQLPSTFTRLGRGFLFGVPNAVVLMLVLYVIAHFVMTRTVFGRYVYAVGGNPEAARLSGVPVKRVLLLCYTLCGALAGVGGIIRASELKSGDPTYGLSAELEVIAAVVVGGTSLAGGEGKILGTLIGALIIAVIRNGMNLTDVESNTQMVVLGGVILGAVVLDILKKNGWRIPRG